jgi:hypothetical protein
MRWVRWNKLGVIGLPNRPTEFSLLQVSWVPSNVYESVFLEIFSRSYLSAVHYRRNVSLVLV